MIHNYKSLAELKPIVMKKLNYITDKEKCDYMKRNQKEQLLKAKKNKAENWFNDKLCTAKYTFLRQKIWGYRIFDFWNHLLGCAIEIDGATHDKEYDAYRDEYNFRRSQIVIVRVKNFDEQDADECIKFIATLDSWKDRKNVMLKNNPLFWINGGNDD